MQNITQNVIALIGVFIVAWQLPNVLGYTFSGFRIGVWIRPTWAIGIGMIVQKFI